MVYTVRVSVPVRISFEFASVARQMAPQLVSLVVSSLVDYVVERRLEGTRDYAAGDAEY